MELSAPLYRLKRRARLLARRASIPLNQALDRVAREEGFARWSLLAARHAPAAPSQTLLAGLRPGDTLLLGARPWQGKTALGFDLLLAAAREGRRGVFISLLLTKKEALDQLKWLDSGSSSLSPWLAVVACDGKRSDVIVECLRDAAPGTVVVIDYLQMLGRPGDSDDLRAQVRNLQRFAGKQGVTLVFLSQIDRSFDPDLKPLPDIGDVAALTGMSPEMFSKTCFLHEGRARFGATALGR